MIEKNLLNLEMLEAETKASLASGLKLTPQQDYEMILRNETTSNTQPFASRN